MDLDLTTRHALVCGSTQGIGQACAVQFAELGATVTLVARDAERLDAVRRALPRPSDQEHRAIAVDFSQPESVGHAVGELVGHTPHQILVNNTGGPPGGLASEAAPEAYLAAFSQHLIVNQLLVTALLPGMKAAGYGRIINVISTSVREPIPNLGVSNTVRGAVASWAKTLSKELGPHGITVNNLLPGFTETARLDKILETRAEREGKSREQVIESLHAIIPARRFGRAEELGFAAAFLASPSAAYINGVSLPVDGGRLNSI